MDLNELISGGIGQQAISGISEKLGIAKDKTQWVVTAAVPLISSAVQYNQDKKPEANQQVQALVDKKGGILDNLGGLFGADDDADNQQIVSGIFGKNTDQVTNTLAEKSGLSGANISKILGMLGPIVMSFVTKNSGNGGGLLNQITSAASGGLGGMLGGMFGSNDEPKAEASSGLDISSLASEFFNQDNDNKGNALDKIVGMFGK